MGVEKFQFTPLREGRHAGRVHTRQAVHISIHAPPRGATPLHPRGLLVPRYFNSRPSARGDVAKNEVLATGKIFQFTPLREGRRLQPSRTRRRDSYFNSRPSARGDGSSVNDGWTIKLFQFTPLREGRPPPAQLHQDGQNISIHAPPRGATPFVVFRCSMLLQFQFTPLREGRPAHKAIQASMWYFNSRPSARGDRQIALIMRRM